MKFRMLGALGAFIVVLLGASSVLASPAPSWWVAASRGAQELMGSGDGSVVAWNPQTGLWGGHSGPHWWQSALAITTLVRYAERTNDRSPAIQRILVQTYQRGRHRNDFTNQDMDDTEWWGLAWLAASRYELHYLHDQADAATFLATAEADAASVAGQPRTRLALASHLSVALSSKR